MATTHVFIVNSTTFKYHLEYMFVGTGAKDIIKINFNNIPRNLLGMIADSQRIKKGDYVIFYLQQSSSKKIYEGKFFGVFKIKETTSFLDNSGKKQYLIKELGKSLILRAIIEPNQVYADGVTEWEALDNINLDNINLDNIKKIAPYQMLWSLIYRKLRAYRGNTMITLYESERLIQLIRKKNSRKKLSGRNFSFEENTQKIVKINRTNKYTGKKEKINILPELISKYKKGNQFEAHLQTYILQNIKKINIFKKYNIEWIGNEVSCGVGMQRIDIMLSIDGKDRKIIPIELKSTCAYKNKRIINQIQRYLDWLEQYYIPNKISYDIEPMIISRKVKNKKTDKYTNFINGLQDFNKQNKQLSLKVRYVEFEIIDDKIKFVEVNY